MASDDSSDDVVKFAPLKVPNEALRNFYEPVVRQQLLFRVFERGFVQLQRTVRSHQVLCILQIPCFRFFLQISEHGGHSGDFQEQPSLLFFRAGKFASILINVFGEGNNRAETGDDACIKTHCLRHCELDDIGKGGLSGLIRDKAIPAVNQIVGIAKSSARVDFAERPGI